MGLLTIGAHTYGSPILRGTHNNVTIGKFCSIAEGVIFDGGFSHNHRNVSTYPFNPNWTNDVPLNLKIKGDIVVGNDVWIGEGAVIMSGVTIGDGAVIGMRTIVTKNVHPYEIVVGAPMKSIGNRITHRQIYYMTKEIKWWDWEEDRIRAFMPLLVSDDIEKFIEFALQEIA
jgi:chloramphenicol O-acetyltransferase type B